MEKRAIYRVGFRALEILGFSSFKKRCPKVGLAFNTGRGRDLFWTRFDELFWKFKNPDLLGIWRWWRKKSQVSFEFWNFCGLNKTAGSKINRFGRGSLIWGFNKTAGGWFGRGPITMDWRDLNNLDNKFTLRATRPAGCCLVIIEPWELIAAVLPGDRAGASRVAR